MPPPRTLHRRYTLQISCVQGCRANEISPASHHVQVFASQSNGVRPDLIEQSRYIEAREIRALEPSRLHCAIPSSTRWRALLDEKHRMPSFAQAICDRYTTSTRTNHDIVVCLVRIDGAAVRVHGALRMCAVLSANCQRGGHDCESHSGSVLWLYNREVLTQTQIFLSKRFTVQEEFQIFCTPDPQLRIVWGQNKVQHASADIVAWRNTISCSSCMMWQPFGSFCSDPCETQGGLGEIFAGPH